MSRNPHDRFLTDSDIKKQRMKELEAGLGYYSNTPETNEKIMREIIKLERELSRGKK